MEWLCLTVVFGCHCLPATDGDLVVKPRDKTVAVNDSVQLPCRTNLGNSVDWLFKSSDSNVFKEIFYGGERVKAYSDRLEILTNAALGEYNVFIASADMSHLGLYKCVDNEGFGEEAIANLSVAESVEKNRRLESESDEENRMPESEASSFKTKVIGNMTNNGLRNKFVTSLVVMGLFCSLA